MAMMASGPTARTMRAARRSTDAISPSYGAAAKRFFKSGGGSYGSWGSKRCTQRNHGRFLPARGGGEGKRAPKKTRGGSPRGGGGGGGGGPRGAPEPGFGAEPRVELDASH